MNNRRIAVYIVAAALIGGVIGSAVSGRYAEAWSIGDFFKNLLPVMPTAKLTQSSTSTAPYQSKVDYEQRVISAVSKANPAVVSIVITKDVPVIENCPFDPFSNLPPEFRQFFGDSGSFTQPCQKGTKRQEIGGGSGFIINSDGTIVTNKHVVADTGASYTVFTNDGKKYNATVLARDPAVDFAVIKINGSNFPTLPLGNSDSLQLGETVIAIGNALGEFRNTVSVGVVSGLRRNVTASGGGSSETIEGVIQTDAAINPGNSGGPLLNLDGQVVGINTAVATGAQNVGFALPVNQVKRAITSLARSGRIQVPYVGVRYLMVTEDLVQKEKLPVGYGALVRGNEDGPAVIKDSPADRAGLKAEDVILEVNGEKVDGDHSLGSLIQKYSVGDSVKLKVQRGNGTIDLSVTLEERKV